MTPDEGAKLINATMDRYRDGFAEEGPMVGYNAMAELLVSAGVVDCSAVDLLQLTDGAYKEGSKPLQDLIAGRGGSARA